MSISPSSGGQPAAPAVTARGSGLWLMFAVWLAVFGAVYAWFHDWNAAQVNPNQVASLPMDGYRTRLERVRIGPIELRDVAAVATDGMDEAIVLLGMSFLKRVEFAQRGDRLTLRVAPGTAGNQTP